MPVCRIKRGERPGEPRAGNTAIHQWIFLDIRRVIESDELMPDYLRVNPKGHYRKAEQDEEIESLKSSRVAEWSDTSFVPRTKKSSFSFSRCSFSHLFARLPEDGQLNIYGCGKAFKPLCGTRLILGSHKIAAGIPASTLSQ